MRRTMPRGPRADSDEVGLIGMYRPVGPAGGAGLAQLTRTGDARWAMTRRRPVLRLPEAQARDPVPGARGLPSEPPPLRSRLPASHPGDPQDVPAPGSGHRNSAVQAPAARVAAAHRYPHLGWLRTHARPARRPADCGAIQRNPLTNEPVHGQVVPSSPDRVSTVEEN
jgi:hypothetical protein